MPARGLLGHGLEPGQRTPAPGGGGRAPTGPWEAGARGQGPQVLLTGALKILQRVWAAGGGVVAVSTSRSPCRCCWTCWRRGGEIRRRAPPRTRPSGPGRVAMSAATIDRYLAPAAAGPRPRAGPGLRGSIKIRRAGGRGGGRARVLRGPSPSPTAVRCSRGSSPGPLSTTRCAHGVDLHPLDPQQRREAHHLGPGRRRGRDPVPRAGHGLRQRVGIHRPRRGAVGREPGASTPARSRPHGKNDQATIETREATTWCAATPSTTATDADAERQVPGRLWEPARHPSQLPRPPPASPSGGAPAGRVGASACTTGPAHPQAGCWTPTP